MNYPNRKKVLSYTYRSKTFSGKIFSVNGKKEWKPESELWLKHELQKYNVGDKVTMMLTNRKPKRTEAQNNYYWLYIHLVATETGNNADDLHSLFKGKFLGSQIVEVMGEKVRRTRSTTDLSVGEFIDYIIKIEAFTEIQAPPTESFGLAPLKSYMTPLTPVLEEQEIS